MSGKQRALSEQNPLKSSPSPLQSSLILSQSSPIL